MSYETCLNFVYNTVKSFNFVGLKFRGFDFKNEFVDINFRCFLMCSHSKIRLFKLLP